MPTSAPDQFDTWVTESTRADRHALIDSMSAHELRAMARYLMDYQPAAFAAAIADRLRLRGYAGKRVPA